jgi:ABC-type transport system substrate-binding protein
MTKTRKLRLALLAVFALAVAACGGTSSTTTAAAGETTTTAAGATTTSGAAETTTTAAAMSDAIISTYIGEPEHLSPSQTNESEGSAVLKALFAGLYDYDPVTTEPIYENGVAESITSADVGKTWDVTLKDGWTFHDGTPVNADSFINAWNYNAYGPNASQVSGFFAPIEGFADLQCGTTKDADGNDVPDCEGAPPAAETLSGLTKTDDLHFTITLSEAQTFFATELGYTAFFPQPAVFFDDPVAFEEHPIGNGPFMMDGDWVHDTEIKTVAYADYAGANMPQIGGIDFKIYADVNTAINDLEAGNLDIVDSLTPDRADEVKNSVPNFGESPSSSINYLGFPLYQAQYQNPDIRAALSMAIDQESLVASPIFNGTRKAAFNLQSPVIPGYQESVCPNWSYDPATAKQLWDNAGGIQGDITVWFNEGAGHDQWVEAVVNMWAENLGIDAASVKFEQLQFADYLPKLDGKEVTGPFRLGWGMDYPHPQDYWQLLLDSRFTSDQGGSNSTFYSNPAFDAKIDEANSKADLNDAIPLYQEAAKIACEDTPLIPMFYGLNQYAWNDTVGGVYVDAFGNVDYTALTAG